MTPRPSHPGRPGTPVIPDGWEAAHRPVADASRRGLVQLRLPGYVSQGWSEEAGQVVSTPHPAYWTGRARIVALAGQANRVVIADDPETVADYLVTIDANTAAEIAEGHLVDVIDSGDHLLDGRSLRVGQVVRGTERFSRDLFCTHTD